MRGKVSFHWGACRLRGLHPSQKWQIRAGPNSTGLLEEGGVNEHSFQDWMRNDGFGKDANGQWSKRKADSPRLPASQPEPAKGKPLVRRIPREETSGPRFEIVFTIYARRPCDFDGYHIKPIIDMAVHAGILPGDAWHQLEGSVRSAKVSTTEEERTEITIIPL